MTDSPPLTVPGRRQRMRDLRTGEIAIRHEPESPQVVTGGRAPSHQAFLASLGHALTRANSGQNDGRNGADRVNGDRPGPARVGAGAATILVFRARACPVQLHRWSEPASPPIDELDTAVDDLLMSIDPSIVVHRLDGDTLGFVSEPTSHDDAEAIGGLVAAGLAMVIGDSWPRVGLDSRLGVAVVDGRSVRSAGLTGAVAEALASVDRAIGHTTADTPYLVHNDYLRSRTARHHEIAAALEPALTERQITIEFQPRATAADLIHVGLEVFPRWNSPDLGSVPTVEFLRVAEANGLLGPLGRQVRSDATAMARRWAADGTLGERRLWFDVAPIEMLDRPFLDEVAELARSADAGSGIAVGFEVSDDPVLEQAVFAPVFEAIEELGVPLALDNVRPSTMSLGRIQELPFSSVNLDRELARTVVDDTGRRDLVRAICGFANDRGMAVTACQVETDEELAVLVDLGVDQVQGFAVTEPLPESELWPQLDGLGLSR